MLKIIRLPHMCVKRFITNGMTQQTKRFRCNQCEAAMINGVFCHETGCPNTKARYDVESGEWVKQYKCFECGCMADADTICCSNDDYDDVEVSDASL